MADVLKVCFQMRWPDVDILTASRGARGIALAGSERPDLIVLDVNLPDYEGYIVCQSIRRFSDVPIIMLTTRSDVFDKVRGLELGADDYVTKPFNHLELLARVQAVLRRLDMPAPKSRAPSFKSGEMEMDFNAQELRVKGDTVPLTPTEYKLLYHLVRN